MERSLRALMVRFMLKGVQTGREKFGETTESQVSFLHTKDISRDGEF